MELSHAVPVFDMPMIAIIRNQPGNEKRPQYPTHHQQQNTRLHRLQTRMRKREYSRWKRTQLLPL
jgi:hypothetical protein